jgi:adenylate kinase
MILFFGPPGSGKSIQGKLLVQRNNWNWLSTGELFRNSDDPAILAHLATGELIDDERTNKLLDDTLRSITDKRRVVLDGYPRNTRQAEWLEEHLPNHGREIVAVIVFEVERDELIKRLAGRGRDEDKIDVIKKRLDIYSKRTEPVIAFFEHLGVPICRIDGHGDVNTIHERIQDAVKKCVPKG